MERNEWNKDSHSRGAIDRDPDQEHDAVLVMGLGRAGQIHVEKFTANGIPVLAFDQERSDEEIRRVGATPVDDWREALTPGTVVDICLPNTLHFEYLERAKAAGARKFIVEKPVVCDRDQLDSLQAFDDVRIATNHNYLLSEVTATVLDLLESYSITPDEMVTNFSKNRSNDFAAKRGFHGRHPWVAEIEVPHQLALGFEFYRTRYGTLPTDWKLDGWQSSKNTCELALELPGSVVLRVESSMREDVERRFELRDGRYRVVADYLSYCEELEDPKPATVTVYDGETQLESRSMYDDNMHNSLLALYRSVNGDDEGTLEWNFGVASEVVTVLDELRRRTGPHSPVSINQ